MFNIYKMNIEYIVIIATIVFVVIFGSILLYLIARPKNIEQNLIPDTRDFKEKNNTKNEYESNNISNEKITEISKIQNINEIALIKNTQLSTLEMESANTLQIALKITKNKTPMQLKENATKIIFILFGNMHRSLQNELFMHDNKGNLIVKLKFLPDANKVVINDWHETENLFASSEPWPKTIVFAFNENMIRMNNIMIYEFPDDDYRIYRYIKLDAKGVKEIQLLSINEINVTAEEVINKH